MLLVCCGFAVAGCADRGGAALADGGSFDFGAQGGWVVVNYWAEWCGPCRHEIPELNRLHLDEEDVVVLGVNYDGLTGDKLRAVVERMDIDFPVLVEDPRERWQQALPTVLPSTYLIAPDGQLIDVLLGPQSMASIKGRMDEHSPPG
ncbi:MAG: TlpA disulfide reductase family protein [Pseudomonadota bacterium]